ncbi:MAG: dUTP diphosphatase [Patescibacteria group bacterium]|nr:dUTP diphosphatase [Patescibacteria group bacterium]
MQVRITKLKDDIALPAYQTPGAAGFDLASAEDVVILPGQSFLVPTGLVIATPPGHVLILTARSSLFKKKGLMLANGVGTIDSDYCGPNDQLYLSCYNPGQSPVSIAKGERLAQGIFLPFVRAEFQEGTADAPDRGGFGSTG